VKNTIDQHISSLLFAHECVVVPEFGAFLTRYFGAEINPATNMLRPPSKRVAFNARIDQNDGILAKHVAAVEEVSYQQALESIEISVRRWKKILRAGKKVNLLGIGRLFLDEHGHLQFNPAYDLNYNIQSYGLNIFRASAMQREQEIKQSVNKAIESHTQKKKPAVKSAGNKDKAEDRQNKEGNTSWLRWVAILGPVAALLFVGSYYYTQEREAFNNASGHVVDFFSPPKAEEALYDAGKEEPQEESQLESEKLNGDFGPEDDVISEQAEAEGITTEESTASHDEATYEASPQTTVEVDNASDSQNSARANKDVDETDAAEANVPQQQSYAVPTSNLASGEYQVVVGSFKDGANASSYVKQLQSMGYQAYTSPQTGFHRVAIGKFSSAQEAQQLLNLAKKDLNAQAWINGN
jgi:cell division septation protein DedD